MPAAHSDHDPLRTGWRAAEQLREWWYSRNKLLAGWEASQLLNRRELVE